MEEVAKIDSDSLHFLTVWLCVLTHCAIVSVVQSIQRAACPRHISHMFTLFLFDLKTYQWHMVATAR